MRNRNNLYGRTRRWINKNALDPKIIDNNDEIIIKMKIQDLFPLEATWYSGNEPIAFASHYIDGVSHDSWSERFKTVENKKDYMNKYLAGLENNDVEFVVYKKKFKNKKTPIKCLIDLVNLEVYKNTMNEYCDDIISIKTSNSYAQHEAAKKMRKNQDLYKSSCVITFNSTINGFPNFVNYEYVYDTSRKKDKNGFSNQKIFKKVFFDLLTNAIITVAFFGSVIFGARRLLSKYF
jgi:hypothetical protein